MLRQHRDGGDAEVARHHEVEGKEEGEEEEDDEREQRSLRDETDGGSTGRALRAGNATGGRLGGKSGSRRGRELYAGGILFLLVLATTLCLAGVLLNLGSGGRMPAAETVVVMHDDHDDDDDDEQMPRRPRLRNSSEYVLSASSSWDAGARPVTREYRWTVTDGRLNPDGVYRAMTLINNQFPGPLVECNEGDTMVVRVRNRAANATSLHFHGLFQNGTNAMDGAVGVTQCAIAPGADFTYRFRVHGQSGTFWYHAHHSGQASDGLVGPLVVHPAAGPLGGYATDRVVMVQDHYHNTTAELLMGYLAPDMENNEPVPDNALINGRGARDCDDFPGWDCDTVGLRGVSPPVLDLPAGQRHRIRFINVGAMAEFQIQIDHHPFYITEVDATDVHAAPFHRLNILPAQRYSIVVEANLTTHDAYWLRARMVTRCFATRNPRLRAEVRAIVRYTSPPALGQEQEEEPPAREPTSHDWPDAAEVTCRDLNTSSLVPVRPVDPPPADAYLILRADVQIGDWALARGFLNGSTWRPNATHPSLHRFLDAVSSSSSSPLDEEAAATITINDRVFTPDRDLVLQTTGLRTLDIAINNFDDGAHPFHLHGHTLFLMAQARSGYPPTAASFALQPKPRNPLRRDTVTVEGYSWAIVRVVLDNPGLWLLHCHNTWHLLSGMAMQVLSRADVVRGWELDPRHRDMCRLEGVESGMRPDDSIWYGVPGEAVKRNEVK